MRTFTPDALSERDNYKLLTGSIIPRPIAFITSISEDGKINAAPFSYFNIVSANPPMISVSLQRSNGSMKDTARNIKAMREFVVHIVDEENVREINETAASLSYGKNELERTSFTLAESTTISVPGIQEAKVRFECTLEHTLELGSASEVSTDFLIGKITQYHIDDTVYQDGKIDPQVLGAVSRLAGSNYSTLGEIFAIERPN